MSSSRPSVPGKASTTRAHNARQSASRTSRHPSSSHSLSALRRMIRGFYDLPPEVQGMVVTTALRRDLCLQIMPAYLSQTYDPNNPSQRGWNQAARFAVLKESEVQEDMGEDIDVEEGDTTWPMWEYNAAYGELLTQFAYQDWNGRDDPAFASGARIQNQDVGDLFCVDRRFYDTSTSFLSATRIPIEVVGVGPLRVDTLSHPQRVACYHAETLVLRLSWSERFKPHLQEFIHYMPRLSTVLLPTMSLCLNIDAGAFSVQHLYRGIQLRRRTAYDLLTAFLGPLLVRGLRRKPYHTTVTFFREVIVSNQNEQDSVHPDRRRSLALCLGRTLRSDDSVSPIFIARCEYIHSSDVQHRATTHRMLDVTIPQYRRLVADCPDADAVEISSLTDPLEDALVQQASDDYDRWDQARLHGALVPDLFHSLSDPHGSNHYRILALSADG